MLFCRRILNQFTSLRAAWLCSLIVLLCLVGCGSDEGADQLQSKVSTDQSQQAVTKSPAAETLQQTDNATLHATGIETYVIGLSSGDPATIAQGISLLEEAAIAEPDNANLWLDLADAYINSDLFIEYPYAIDIYWMLLEEERVPKDYLYARLAEAYEKMGESQAAFEIGLERVRNADAADVNHAALHLSFLALSNYSFDSAAEALTDKAKGIKESGYLLLLAATLKEAAGNKEAAISLIEQALPSLENNPAATEMARNEQRRLAQ